MTGRDAEREHLAAALVEGVGSQMPRGKVWNIDKALEPLLPVVDRIANERAAAALEAAADWLEGDPDKGGAPLIASNFSVLFADRLDIAQAVSWAGASLRDRAAALTAGSEAGM